jgi:hypothetical protein
MKFAIIGAGFYGLHIAARLRALGLEVTIYERENDILSFASGNNQYRLHLGFHYARNFRTRQQSRDGYFRFLERYDKLTREVSKNYYLVPQGDSIVDFSTYKLIMMSSGLDFVETQTPSHISYPCGSIITAERILLIEESRQYFQPLLADSLRLGEQAQVQASAEKVTVNGSDYDYCIDCTWGHLMPDDAFFFESTILLFYRRKHAGVPDDAYTFVDGPLCSLYPTETPSVFTLSSVPHTPIQQHQTSEAARETIRSMTSHDIHIKRLLMERQIMRYYPSFPDDFEYIDPQLCVKTKPHGDDDDRSCYVRKSGRLIKCLSGKVDNIFFAASEVMSLIEADNK